MKSLQVIGIAILAALPGVGQTAPATCATPPASLTAFNIERTLTLGSAGLFTTGTPSIPPSVLAALLGGALELREAARLDTGTNVLTVQTFTAQPGSPSPAPANSIQAASVVSSYRLQVENVYFSCQPVPSALIVGRVLTNFPNTPFGNVTNALVAMGLGYTTDNPPKINNVTVLVPGVAGLYSPSAVGTITFPASTVTPPGTTGNRPTVVFTPAQAQTWSQKQMQLDASKSTDPNGLQLTYAWRQVNTNISAGINNANTATPLITFGPKGDYTFEVTVTNSQGAQSTAQTTISYTGQ